MAAPPRRPLLTLLAGLLVVASLATLAEAIYEDQVGLADWCVFRPPRSDPPLA